MNENFDSFMMEGHILDTPKTRKVFKHILQLGNIKRVFEIGFNGGHSARMWLDLGVEHLHSIDICQYDYTEHVARDLEIETPRFAFTKASSYELNYKELKGYDLLFIDGDHSQAGILNDFWVGQEAEIPYILFDDYVHTGWLARCGDWIDQIMHSQDDYTWCSDTYQYDSTGGINQMRMCKWVK
jgi:hypothetical protein